MSAPQDAARDEDRVRAAAFRLVSARGGSPVTPEEIAATLDPPPAELGLTDPDDVLLAAVHWSHRRIARRFFDLTAGRFGLAALRAGLIDLLPLDEDRLQETVLEVAMWHRGLVSPKIAANNRREREDLSVIVRGVLRDARDDGELIDGVDVDRVTAELLALIDGLSVHALLYPERMSGTAAARALDAELDRIARPGTAPEGH
ncbi:TetR family transcriptional regulator C-terminal domain-containing protein (plasmid) [Embleya sp. NBC_00888]|uniref:TetR family transcriptional regulator C-terminal domain-containing protein n=1 Tax=Embleya sp. NBC_00888 TaxID=2975960 RepID=UPI002F909D3C|nr:TetR family transcriptional regulator C-terminal domain-containing protein [Embleya sp. NBC_00888]